jgi:hypothetical protein
MYGMVGIVWEEEERSSTLQGVCSVMWKPMPIFSMRHHQHQPLPSILPLIEYGEGQRTQLHYSVHGQQMRVTLISFMGGWEKRKLTQGELEGEEWFVDPRAFWVIECPIFPLRNASCGEVAW